MKKAVKIGTETNNLINNLYSGMKNCPEPEVGMGCTILGWTDRYAATITEIVSDNIIGITRDTVRRVDNFGLSDMQEYEYTSNMNMTPMYYKCDKHGNWRCVYRNRSSSRWIYCGSNYNQLLIGSKKHYHDFSY